MRSMLPSSEGFVEHKGVPRPSARPRELGFANCAIISNRMSMSFAGLLATESVSAWNTPLLRHI